MTIETISPVAITLVLFTVLVTTEACTVFIAGKEATIDGSVLVSHSNDGEFETDPRLVKVPARDFLEGSSRPVYFSPENFPRYVGYERGVPEYYPRDGQTAFEPIGYLPQVEHTFAYLEKNIRSCQ
jgi:dipeptidase